MTMFAEEVVPRIKARLARDAAASPALATAGAD
jgi:hypothetical protein